MLPLDGVHLSFNFNSLPVYQAPKAQAPTSRLGLDFLDGSLQGHSGGLTKVAVNGHGPPNAVVQGGSRRQDLGGG